jgi:chromate transporter
VFQLVVVMVTLSILGFGGGNAIWPQLYTDAVDQYHWVSAVDFSKYFALARLAPGPGTAFSGLLGYAVGGLGGAVIAGVAMFLPAALIVLAISTVYDRFHHHPWRKIFARAMIPVVLGLTWVGITLLSRGALDTPLTYVIAAAACATILWTSINASLVILAAGILGAIVFR